MTKVTPSKRRDNEKGQQMKLTDAKVAKALGWKLIPKAYWKKSRLSPIKGTCYLMKNGMITSPGCGIPPFTTSLDAIVAEIEARGFHFAVAVDRSPETRSIQGDCRAIVMGYCGWSKTVPLALCAALLAYIKETPRRDNESRGR